MAIADGFIKPVCSLTLKEGRLDGDKVEKGQKNVEPEPDACLLCGSSFRFDHLVITDQKWQAVGIVQCHV